MCRTLVAPVLLACALACGAEPQPQSAFPLWNSQESIAEYAKRVNLPATKTLELGNGVNLELVLIPAGKFIMGTPEPKPVYEYAFHKKVVVGKAVLAVGVGVLLVLIGSAILRAKREKRRFQYSLRRFMAMAFCASLCVLGGMHWWYSTCGLQEARAEYIAAKAKSDPDEYPAHEVTITNPFYMGKYEVTQEQYQQAKVGNPSFSKGSKLPVEQVSWGEAQEFCKKVSEKTGQAVRLPTEAEWEFACRAGTTTAYCKGDTEAGLGRVAWYYANTKWTTHPVGEKKPNEWGLYDMHGNVSEWCGDWYGKYEAAAATDPQGPATGTRRVWRGGSSWSQIPGNCRSAKRDGSPLNRVCDLGFRLVLAGPP
ncbi:MAG: SUMF1/EgtB/PvdO family nonheme iron enzyme [Planctomycetota bacterium]